MIPCELLFALGAARTCAPSRRWRVDGTVVTDGVVHVTSHAVHGLADGSLWLWIVAGHGRTRMVDMSGLLRTLAGLEDGARTVGQEDAERPA